MDYSASIHENDQSGDSPWGSPNSPQPNRTAFGSTSGATGEDYQRPFTASSSGGLSDGADGGGFGAGAGDVTDYRRPGTANSIQSTSETAVADEDYEQQYRPQQQPQEQQQQQQYDSQAPLPPKPNDSSYGGGPAPAGESSQQPPQPQRPPQPQYRLQVKITALERSAKKDPIFRFDVHVCWPSITPMSFMPYAR